MVGTLNSLRFGWARHGHEAINGSAYALLKTNNQAKPLTQFIAKHHAEIEGHCLEQDRYFSGAGHFLNAESLWETNGGRHLLRGERAFSKVADFFKPENKKSRMKLFSQGLAGSKVLKEHPQHERENNVYQSVLSVYENLLLKLKSPNIRSEDLEQSIGELAHYVGDLNQPMHTSKFYNWRTMGKGKKKSIHFFMENRLADRAAYKVWYQAIETDLLKSGFKPETLNPKEIRQELKQDLKRCYESMFKIVAIDKEFRERTGEKYGTTRVSNPDYMAGLKSAYKPIAEKHMKEASRLFASLLVSAYEEAGKPALNQLA